jgi:hypothetical protein
MLDREFLQSHSEALRYRPLLYGTAMAFLLEHGKLRLKPHGTLAPVDQTRLDFASLAISADGTL